MATDRLFNQDQGDSLIAAVTALQSRGFTAAQITTLLSTLSGTNTALDAIRAAIASTSRGSVVSVTPAQSSGQAVGTVRVDNVDFSLFSLPTVARTQAALSSVADILEGQEAEKTATGNPVTITAKAAPVRALSVAVEAVQPGSGDPSPTNVRPITGWTAAAVTRTGAGGANPETVTVSFGEAGTVYGGTLDVLSGTLTVDRRLDIITSSYSQTRRVFDATLKIFIYRMPNNDSFRKDFAGPYLICSHYYAPNPSVKWSDMPDLSVQVGDYYVGFRDTRFSTIEEMDAYLNAQNSAGTPVRICYPLATPLTYTLTPAPLSTLAGTNVVYADCGPVDLRYVADISGEIADLRTKINALGGA